MRAKKFDCVEMKRAGADLVQKRLAGMTRVEQLEYWRQRTEALQRRKAELQAQLSRTSHDKGRGGEDGTAP